MTMFISILDVLLSVLGLVFSGIVAITAIRGLRFAMKQVSEARKARVLDAYLTFESRLTSQQSLNDRKHVYEANLDNPAAITSEDRHILENVCATFDVLGVLVREDLMYRPLIFKPFYDVIIKCWKKAYYVIKYEREPFRKAKTYMQDFEYLYEQAEIYRKENGFPEVVIHEPNAQK